MIATDIIEVEIGEFKPGYIINHSNYLNQEPYITSPGDTRKLRQGGHLLYRSSMTQDGIPIFPVIIGEELCDLNFKIFLYDYIQPKYISESDLPRFFEQYRNYHFELVIFEIFHSTSSPYEHFFGLIVNERSSI